MASKNTNNKHAKFSGVNFTGKFWIAPDGRQFNNRLKADQYVRKLEKQVVSSNS